MQAPARSGEQRVKSSRGRTGVQNDRERRMRFTLQQSRELADTESECGRANRQ